MLVTQRFINVRINANDLPVLIANITQIGQKVFLQEIGIIFKLLKKYVEMQALIKN